jgi:hypothetical protein
MWEMEFGKDGDYIKFSLKKKNRTLLLIGLFLKLLMMLLIIGLLVGIKSEWIPFLVGAPLPFFLIGSTIPLLALVMDVFYDIYVLKYSVLVKKDNDVITIDAFQVSKKFFKENIREIKRVSDWKFGFRKSSVINLHGGESIKIHIVSVSGVNVHKELQKFTMM